MANEVINNFKNKIGAPQKEENTHITFKKSIPQTIWERMIQEIGCGSFNNGFFYLFGEKLTELEKIKEYWSFLLRDDIVYTIIGFNKMGFIILAENLMEKGMASSISIIDPFHVRIYKNGEVKLLNFIGRWLPDGLIPNLNDDHLYRATLQEIEEELDFQEIIAIKKPLSLGGEMIAENFGIENIQEFYKSTGEIYSKLKK